MQRVPVVKARGKKPMFYRYFNKDATHIPWNVPVENILKRSATLGQALIHIPSTLKVVPQCRKIGMFLCTPRTWHAKASARETNKIIICFIMDTGFLAFVNMKGRSCRVT